MIMYTAIPQDQLWDGFDDKVEPYQEIYMNGLIMQVQPLNAYQAKIVRIVSPDPQDYLNPSYLPGQMIRFRPSVDA